MASSGTAGASLNSLGGKSSSWLRQTRIKEMAPRSRLSLIKDPKRTRALPKRKTWDSLGVRSLRSSTSMRRKRRHRYQLGPMMMMLASAKARRRGSRWRCPQRNLLLSPWMIEVMINFLQIQQSSLLILTWEALKKISLQAKSKPRKLKNPRTMTNSDRNLIYQDLIALWQLLKTSSPNRK